MTALSGSAPRGSEGCAEVTVATSRRAVSDVPTVDLARRAVKVRQCGHAGRMRAAVVASFAAALTLAACSSGGVPDREADAVGRAAEVVTEGDTTRVLFEHDAGYEYFEGTTFVIDDEVTVVGVDDRAGIPGGAALEVWTGACAESFPVQCEVEAVLVLAP